MDTQPTDRRERFILACLDAGETPVDALKLAKDMETFVVTGSELKRLPAPDPTSEPVPDVTTPVDKEDEKSVPVDTALDNQAGGQPPEEPRDATEQQQWNTKWTVERIDAFTEAWKNVDETVEAIGKRFDLKPGTVRWKASNLGLGRRPKREAPREPVRAVVEVEQPSPEPPFDTSGLPPAPKPEGKRAVTVETVLHFLGTRDIHVRLDSNSVKTKRWLVEGRHDEALTKEELLSYANGKRRAMGKPEFYYGV